MECLFVVGQDLAPLLVAEKITEDDWRMVRAPENGYAKTSDWGLFQEIATLIGLGIVHSVRLHEREVKPTRIGGYAETNEGIQALHEWLLPALAAQPYPYQRIRT